MKRATLQGFFDPFPKTPKNLPSRSANFGRRVPVSINPPNPEKPHKTEQGIYIREIQPRMNGQRELQTPMVANFSKTTICEGNIIQKIF
ncbi:MAG: hypothetical protein IZT59_08320 [Verrucomicrobia bacterium]|jgi:hypothetical protein|nr:hypothetical protein [Verrucomicrobiota bacterium]|tara:strand:+ start:29053 stop:29319 length:267 start_codon:yes stop_codon:yes gene_type:complete